MLKSNFFKLNNYINFYLFFPKKEVLIEIIAVIIGILSVYLMKRKNILGYPVGVLNILILSYLNFNWNFYGETMLNACYLVSIFYGWWSWKKNISKNLTITKLSNKEILLISLYGIIFNSILTIFYSLKRNEFDLFFSNDFLLNKNDILDVFRTSIFFLGMYLMAKIKLENWILWIIGNGISLYLYLGKNYPIIAFQYIVFFILSIFSYIDWSKKMKNSV